MKWLMVLRAEHMRAVDDSKKASNRAEALHALIEIAEVERDNPEQTRVEILIGKSRVWAPRIDAQVFFERIAMDCGADL